MSIWKAPVRVLESYRNKTIGGIAGAVVVAAVAGVTGCSKEESGAEKKPEASSSSAAGPEKTQQGEKQGESPQASRSSAEGAVGAWVTAIVKGQPKQACLVMAQPAKGSSPAQVGTPKRCNSNAPDVRKMEESVGRLRASFTPKQSSGDPKVDVAKVPATGDKTLVPADKITVDGQTLDKAILSNSTGLKPGQLDVKVESTKIEDAWYVTNFDMNLG